MLPPIMAIADVATIPLQKSRLVVFLGISG